MWEDDPDDRRAPPLAQLLIRSRPASTGRDPFVALDLVTTRGRPFVLPAGSPTVAASTLLAYNGLRPRRVRAARRAIAMALRLGAARAITTHTPILAPAGADDLVSELARHLGEPELLLAASDIGGTGFRSPVLQLFTSSGRPRGYAKVGWDPVTIAMIDTEADALMRAGRAGWSSVSVPTVAWHGSWHDLRILVTDPMPTRIRRLTARELPPIDPLREISTLWGPPVRNQVTATRYWADARGTAQRAMASGRAGLLGALTAFADRHGEIDLRFGAWHGDWVEWNLGRVGRDIVAWDWSYAAAGVPLGFDVLQFFHLRHRNLHQAPPETALARAARDAVPGMAALGLDRDERAATTDLHRIEVALRLERARQLRSCARTTVGAIA